MAFALLYSFRVRRRGWGEKMPLWYGKPVEVRADRTPRAGPRWVPNWARLLLVVGIKVHSSDAVASA